MVHPSLILATRGSTMIVTPGRPQVFRLDDDGNKHELTFVGTDPDQYVTPGDIFRITGEILGEKTLRTPDSAKLHIGAWSVVFKPIEYVRVARTTVPPAPV